MQNLRRAHFTCFRVADCVMRYKAALEAMTLYKNEKSTLPLSDTKNKKVALIGPQGTNAGTCAY